MKKILLICLISACIYFFEFNPILEVLLIVFVSVCFIHFVIELLPLLGFYIGKIIGSLKRKSIQLDKSDFENNKVYYREILNINSPLILGYLDNFDVDTNSLIAELLYLEEKNAIWINDGVLKKMDNVCQISDLSSLDIKILNNIKDGKLKIVNYDIFLKQIKNDVKYRAKELSLLEEYKKNNKKHEKKIKNVINKILEKIKSIINFIKTSIEKRPIKTFCIAIVIICIFSFILALIETIFPEVEWKLRSLEDLFTNIYIILIFAFFIWLLFVTSFNDGYRQEKEFNLYKRTAKGRELNQKLEGLKNYLKDYSLMDEREAKEIELWDDYLIYSVMFGQNKKIIEEYEKYIEIIE